MSRAACGTRRWTTQLRSHTSRRSPIGSGPRRSSISDAAPATMCTPLRPGGGTRSVSTSRPACWPVPPANNLVGLCGATCGTCRSPTRSFEAALSVYSIQFFEPGQLLSEVGRVLVPGGRLVLDVPMPVPGSSARRLKKVASRVGVVVGLARHHREPSLRRALAAAGFSVLDRRDFRRSYGLLCTNEQASPSGSSRL